MDKLEQYRQCIQNLLSNYAATPIANGEIESQTVFDLQQDRYQVMNVGWDGNRRVHGCALHLDIKDGKIWVQQNTTELRIAHELVAMGIPKEDIILGFQAPYMREYTGFGVA
ncbi:XisI protein [Desmonostoc muscorum LEGE 12446]|uniref:XisI protein n=1 Tax=Desmonostoc muscorum LEGE 12446 TaxID=1828758 RepID=A0A8J6ZP77_DESMC|nr:XisI protein [Desmonostoc muscorum]MCF2148070.1 XisI protein [Desmonostoc muscorum LEGE 12446]